MTAAEAKSGKYTYYICHSLLKRGKGTCKTPRLNAKKFEKLIDDDLRANILTESNIRDLVKHLDEEMDGAAREHRQKLESIEAELEEVKKQLGRVWHFISKSDSIDVAAASGHIVELRERKENLESAADEARAVLAERRQYLDSADTIATFAEEMSEFLTTSELTETKAFVHSFVKEVQVKPGRAAIIYSMPTPDDSPLGGADSAEIALNGGVSQIGTSWWAGLDEIKNRRRFRHRTVARHGDRVRQRRLVSLHLDALHEVADERLPLGDRPVLKEVSEVRHVLHYLLGVGQDNPALLKPGLGVPLSQPPAAPHGASET